MRGNFLVAGLFNILALSALFIGNVGWKCEKGYGEAASKYMSDAPYYSDRSGTNDVDDDDYDYDDERVELSSDTREVAVPISTDGEYTPSYLQWDAAIPKQPKPWSFVTPKGCKNITNFESDPEHTRRKGQKIIVHYHLQHNAGTEFYGFARQFVPCATRACWQDARHCMVSYNEEVEANNIRQNYRENGVQYVSYEMMLPPRFPLPYVSKTAREGLYFTTIVRDPFSRFLTFFRRATAKKKVKENGLGPGSAFFVDLQGKIKIYAGDNLNVRWLSGAQERISSDHVNVAKCRLQLFDLVIADKLFDYAVKKVMCPLNNWKGKRHCEGEISKEERKSKKDPLVGTVDTMLIGAWIERLRPSFEIYDYARLLSWKQLKEKGVEDLPELSEVPSYMATLKKYTNMSITDEHFKRIETVSLENEEHFHPPVEFCNKMKQIWTSNSDEIPNAYGIGTIMNGFHPTTGKAAQGKKS